MDYVLSACLWEGKGNLSVSKWVSKFVRLAKGNLLFLSLHLNHNYFP